jgi:ribosomal protein L37AE/L43A
MIQHLDMTDRYFCPNCKFTWYGMFRCPVCNNEDTEACFTVEREAINYLEYKKMTELDK